MGARKTATRGVQKELCAFLRTLTRGQHERARKPERLTTVNFTLGARAQNGRASASVLSKRSGGEEIDLTPNRNNRDRIDRVEMTLPGRIRRTAKSTRARLTRPYVARTAITF